MGRIARDHGKGRQDRGIAHFIDSLDRNVDERASPAAGQAEMSDDVFDDYDGVVNQNPDGEDQSK